MERESFEDAATAAFMNEHFVNVKVDREERPDIDALYMEAVQAISGQGGWPMTVFCDPEGVPFYGGTYFPPDDGRGMPSFRMVMEAVLEAFENRRDELQQQAPRTQERLAAVAAVEPSEAAPDEELLELALEGLRERADRTRGGFGGAPKFPPASSLELLLARGETGQVELTLDAMMAGGIYDQIGGGFARYSVDGAWQVPHFEKMLYDNALLARDLPPRLAGARARPLPARLRGDAGLDAGRDARPRGRLLLGLRRRLRGRGGPLLRLDAGSDPLGPRRRRRGGDQVLRGDRGRELRGRQRPPPRRRGVRRAHRLADRGPPSPLRGAERPGPPGLDDKRLASWNALAIAALAEAGAALGRSDYLDAARSCAGFVLGELRDPEGRLLRTYRDGEARLNAYLEDHAFLVEALLTLYEATFEERWYVEARDLAETMIRRFGDPERGAFFSTSEDHEALIARRKEVGDHPIPSGNSAAALGLLRLAALSGEREYEDQAAGVLQLYGRIAPRQPDAFAHLLRALDFHLSPVKEVALVGERLDHLAAVVRGSHRPHLVLAGGVEGTDTPELLRHRTEVGGEAAAYVCESFSCQAPVTDPQQLAANLEGSSA